MRAYDAVFCGASSFLAGVFLSSFLPLRASVFIALICAGAIFFLSYALRKKFLAYIGILFLFFALGGVIYFARAQSGVETFQNSIPQNDVIMTASVVGDPERGNTQRAVVLPEGKGMRKILVTLPAYPALLHGDTLKLVGRIETPENEGYSKYLAARGIGGTMYFPKMLAHKEGEPSLHRALFSIKRAVVATFSRSLPREHSALLSGITLGEREGFSKELKDAMSKSGTSHITALSGYNITVVSAAILSALSFFMNKRRAFIFALAAILLFVVMTGAEPSVVRAAIMGSILLFARQAGRKHSARNVIALTAFFMVLYNPYVLSFDAGFQLSFAALLGIIYIAPLLLPHGSREGFLGVREGAVYTISAQAAVFPIISSYFGTASLTSILANVLIVGVIPLTMFLGFALGALGFFSEFFASLLGWAVGLLLSYKISVIYFFSNVSVPLPHIGVLGAVLYYGLLVFVVARHETSDKRHETRDKGHETSNKRQETRHDMLSKHPVRPPSNTGALGENIACGYLARKGYKIIERNFRKPWGEIDIVARAPGGCLVFVEVKTVRKTSSESLAPEEQMTSAKIKKVYRAASLYAGYRTELVRRAGWRIDLVAITLENDAPSITHYENI